MKVSMHRWMIVIYLIALICFGCVCDDENNNTEPANSPDESMEKFIWETNGGGDILFSISRVDSQFEITVQRYNFKTVDAVFMLTETDGQAFNFVDDVFDRDVNLKDYTFEPQGGTGSWTKISLILKGNREVTIENIEAGREELKALYNFVTENMESVPSGDIEKFIWETNGGGDILFSISRVEDQFEIAVQRYHFQTVDVVFTLTESDGQTFHFVEDVFTQNVDLNDFTFEPLGETGSWTSISLIFTGSRETTIENIETGNKELRALYDLVKDHI